MKLFYYIAYRINYTFAIALYTVFLFFFTSLSGLVLAGFFVIFPFGDFIGLFAGAYIFSLFMMSFVYFVHYGLLEKAGVPVFLKSHRSINRLFRARLQGSVSELKRGYTLYTDLILNNYMIFLLYTILHGVIMTVCFAYYHYSAGNPDVFQFRALVKILVLATIIVMIVNTVFLYHYVEAITNNERSMIFNRLISFGVRQRPGIIHGLRGNFLFLVALASTGMLSFPSLCIKTGLASPFSKLVIALLFVYFVLFGLYVMNFEVRPILKILREVKRVAREISAGRPAFFRSLSLEKEFTFIENALLEMGSEIVGRRKNLEDTVQSRTYELEEALSHLKLKDEQIQKQLDMAGIIQRSILPGKIEDWFEAKFAVRYYAMDKIGGDFYDVYQMKGEKLGIVMADVSGHGIPAALVTAMAKISFGNAVKKFDSPKKIFQEVNGDIIDHVKTHDYMTCFMVAIDEEYNIVYSNASHQKAIVYRKADGCLERLDTGGLFIGAIKAAHDSYEEKTTKLDYGDRLILYTDGIPEAFNRERKEYTVDRLEKNIIDNASLPLEKFVDAIIDSVQEYTGGLRLEDDITLLVIELERNETVEIIKHSKELVRQYKYYEAVEYLEEASRKYPESTKILYNLSKNYFRINNFSGALEYIEKFISVNKRNKYAYYIAGAAAYKLGDYGGSVEYLNRAVEIDTAFTEAVFTLGMAYKKMNNVSEAARCFEKAASLDSGNKMAEFELRLLKDNE